LRKRGYLKSPVRENRTPGSVGGQLGNWLSYPDAAIRPPLLKRDFHLNKKGVRQMAKPTYQDATLMLQLAQWGAASGLSEATNWMWSEQFVPDYAEFVEKYPPGSEEFRNVSNICGWFETLGTLYKHGLFNEELLFDWLAVGLVWDRIKGFALGQRKKIREPRLYENFEAMAKAQKG